MISPRKPLLYIGFDIHGRWPTASIDARWLLIGGAGGLLTTTNEYGGQRATSHYDSLRWIHECGVYIALTAILEGRQ